MTATSTVARSGLVGETLRNAVSSRPRPVPASAFAAAMTFAWRSTLKIRHVPEQLADVILIPVMFTLLFTYVFGGALAGSTDAYLAYLLPGTLVMSVVVVTIYGGVTLNTDVRSGAFDRFRSLPISRASFLAGSLIGDIGRYLLASVVVLGTGLVLGFRPEGGAVGVAGAVALVVAFGWSLSWPWMLVGLVMRTPSAVQVLGWVAILPATFVSDIFVDPRTTPSWLRTLIDVNPVTHLATAVRGLMHGTILGGEIAVVLLTCVVLVTVFAPLSVRRYAARS